jgi:hypothetical protein
MSTPSRKGLEAPPPLVPRLASNETTRLIDTAPHLTLLLLPSTHQTYSKHLSPTQQIIMVAQTADFKKAVEDSRKLKAKPSDDELLQVRRLAAPKHEEESYHTDWD